MSANIKASTDGTQAIIGVGGVDQMTVSNAGVVTANSFVGAISNTNVTATGSTTARTLANRFADVVNVKDFGAVGNGATDDTAAIQVALASVFSNKKSLYFPAGIYWYDGGGNLGNGNVMFGDGRDATTILSRLASPTSGYLIRASGYGSGLKGLRFAAGVTQTSGSYVWLSSPETFIEDFHMTGDFNGILMTGNVSRIRHGRFQDGAANAIRIRAEGGDNSQLIDDVLMGAQTPQISSAGIRVRNSSALIISNTSVIQQGVGLLIDPTTSTQGANTADGSVFSLYVNNCFFDNSSESGIKINATGTGSVVRSRFANCWAGSSASDGIKVINSGSGIVQGIYFDSCHAVDNLSSSGITTGGTIMDLSINGGLFAQNTNGIFLNNGTSNSKICNATIGIGGGFTNNTANGIVLSSGVTDTTITGNIIRDNSSNGISLNSGSDGFVITNNVIFGNSPNINIASTSNNRCIKNNLGINSPDSAFGNGTMTTGTNSVTVTHGLGITPSSDLIIISPTSSWGSEVLYIDTTSITSTQFTVRRASNATSNLTFAWQVKINKR